MRFNATAARFDCCFLIESSNAAVEFSCSFQPKSAAKIA
jgi:hypothetical protein